MKSTVLTITEIKELCRQHYSKIYAQDADKGVACEGFRAWVFKLYSNLGSDYEKSPPLGKLELITKESE